jgi:hypothetical protein
LGELKGEEEENESFERVGKVKERLEFTCPIRLPVREAFETFDGVPVHHPACYMGQNSQGLESFMIERPVSLF